MVINLKTILNTSEEGLKGIEELRNGLRGKVNELRKLEGDEPSRGTLLSPLSKEEWNGIKQVIGDK